MQKYIPSRLVVILSLTGFLTVATFLTIAPQVSAQTRCADGTAISAGASAGGREEEFCSTRGGVAASEAGGEGDTPITIRNEEGKDEYACGEDGVGRSRIKPAIDLGCRGKGNAIYDLLFAILRFLTIGVGIVAVASMVVAGIQFTSSRGDPKGTAQAMKRIWSTLGALALYLLIYALLNWIVPGGVFNG